MKQFQFLYTRASLLPKMHALEEVYLQVAQSPPWHCTCSSIPAGPGRSVNAELRTGSSLGWGHPQRDGSGRGVGALHKSSFSSLDSKPERLGDESRQRLAGSGTAPSAGCTKPS